MNETENKTLRFDIKEFSGEYEIRRMTEEDIPAMLALCSGNPQYYRYCPPFATKETLAEDLKALPPRKEPRDKYYVGYYNGEGKLIALLDLIDGFPNEDTAFIGFFMMDLSLQGEGLGSRIIAELLEYLTGAGIKAVRLGWVQGNPQAEHFWKKNGFEETGVLAKQERYTIVVAERKPDS